MKRFLYVLGSMIVLVLALVALFLSRKPMPIATSIVGQAYSESTFVLHYSQLPTSPILSFELSKDKVTSSTVTYTALTDSYLPKSLYEQSLQDAANYYTAQALSVPAYFYQHHSEGRWHITAFVGDLSTILIKDLQTDHLYPLTFESSQNLGAMYPYHLQITGDQLTVLGGKVNSYDSMLYTIDLLTGNVQTAHLVATTESAKTAHQTALFAPSQGIFLEAQSIRITDTVTGLEQLIPLDFIPSGITTSDTHILIYGVPDSGKLPYSYFDSNLTPLATGDFLLPSDAPNLIQVFLSADTLTLFTAESSQSYYQNYALTYALTSGKLISCIGLESPNQLFLSGISQLPSLKE